MHGIVEDRPGIEGRPARPSCSPARTARIAAIVGCSTSRNDIGPPSLPDMFSQACEKKSSMIPSQRRS